jgi:hypothetical protein
MSEKKVELKQVLQVCVVVKDIQQSMGGTWQGSTYAYMDTEKAIGAIIEIYKMQPGFEMPAPEAVYPPAA